MTWRQVGARPSSNTMAIWMDHNDIITPWPLFHLKFKKLKKISHWKWANDDRVLICNMMTLDLVGSTSFWVTISQCWEYQSNVILVQAASAIFWASYGTFSSQLWHALKHTMASQTFQTRRRSSLHSAIKSEGPIFHWLEYEQLHLSTVWYILQNKYSAKHHFISIA